MSGIKTYTYEISKWAGLNYLPNITDKAPNDIEDCRNVDFDDDGMIRKRRGCRNILTFSGTINMIYNFQAAAGFTDANDNQRVLIAAGNTLSLIQYFSEHNIHSATFSISDTLHFACSTNNGVAYISNFNGGVPKMLSYVDGEWVYQSAALDAPTLSSTLSATGSGSLSGSYYGVYTYIDAYGNESNPSPEAASAVALSSEQLQMAVVGSSDPTVCSIGIYILSPSATTYHFVGTTSNTTANYVTGSTLTDTIIDSGDEVSWTNFPCPSGRYVCIYNDMLIIGGNLEIPDQIYCSNWGFHRQFNIGEDFDRVTSNDGQPVRGFGVLYSDLIIAKADSLHLGAGADNTVFHTKLYNQDYGAVGQNSILTFEKRLAFFSDDGVYVDSGMIPEEVSRKIRHLWRTMNPVGVFRQPCKQVACHYRYYKKLYFAVRLNQSTDGPMDSLFVYNYENGSWTVHDGFNITALGMSQLSEDYDFMYGGDENGNIFFFSPPNGGDRDDTIGGVTTSINAYAETPWINLAKAKGLDFWERAKTEAMWMKLYAGGEPATGNSTISITTTLYTDFSMTPRATYCTTHAAEEWLSYQQRGLARTDPKLIQAFGANLGQFEWIKLRFANNSPGEFFQIQKVVFGFRIRPGVEE